MGVYDRVSRVWRAKTKNEVTAIEGYDLDGDGVPELVSGWSNGRIEVRSDRNGEIIYKDTLGASVAGIVRADYRQSGREEIICCATDGEVKAYVTAKDDKFKAEALQADRDDDDDDAEQQGLRELMARKQELQFELGQLEAQVKAAGKAQSTTAKDKVEDILPPGTKVSLAIVVNAYDRCVDLMLSTSNDTVIRAVVVFADQLFEGESHAFHPLEPGSLAKVAIRPAKDASAEMNFKVLVSRVGGSQFHVFELTKTMPRFAMYLLKELRTDHGIASSLRFLVPERVPRLIIWLNHSFNIDFNSIAADSVEVLFASLRTDAPLHIRITTTAQGAEVLIHTDDMELAGNVVQDLAAFLDIKELESEANFPTVVADLRATLDLVEGYNASRMKLSVDMADSANLVKSLVIKAEDARLRVDIPQMRTHYRALNDVNRELFGEYYKRSQNHENLLEALKKVNLTIQAAAKLRCGEAKTRVVSECRAAVKANNVAGLLKIIASGHE